MQSARNDARLFFVASLVTWVFGGGSSQPQVENPQQVPTGATEGTLPAEPKVRLPKFRQLIYCGNLNQKEREQLAEAASLWRQWKLAWSSPLRQDSDVSPPSSPSAKKRGATAGVSRSSPNGWVWILSSDWDTDFDDVSDNKKNARKPCCEWCAASSFMSRRIMDVFTSISAFLSVVQSEDQAKKVTKAITEALDVALALVTSTDDQKCATPALWSSLKHAVGMVYAEWSKTRANLEMHDEWRKISLHSEAAKPAANSAANPATTSRGTEPQGTEPPEKTSTPPRPRNRTTAEVLKALATPSPWVFERESEQPVPTSSAKSKGLECGTTATPCQVGTKTKGETLVEGQIVQQAPPPRRSFFSLFGRAAESQKPETKLRETESAGRKSPEEAKTFGTAKPLTVTPEPAQLEERPRMELLAEFAENKKFVCACKVCQAVVLGCSESCSDPGYKMAKREKSQTPSYVYTSRRSRR